MHGVIAPQSTGCVDRIKVKRRTVIFIFAEHGDMLAEEISHPRQTIEARHRIIGRTICPADAIRMGKKEAESGTHIRLKRTERIFLMVESQFGEVANSWVGERIWVAVLQ